MRKIIAFLIASAYLLNFLLIVGICGGIERDLIPARTGITWIVIFVVVQIIDTLLINAISNWIEEGERHENDKK